MSNGSTGKVLVPVLGAKSSEVVRMGPHNQSYGDRLVSCPASTAVQDKKRAGLAVWIHRYSLIKRTCTDQVVCNQDLISHILLLFHDMCPCPSSTQDLYCFRNL